jgi:pSer/pThr/pTyr-binding forkhead associated (FHA) protein
MRTLRVISGATAGEELPVEGDLVIGRETADLVLPDPEVSRQHAIVRPTERGVEIEDLGSQNGTFIDERRLEGVETLASNATLRLGTTRLAVEIAVAAEVTAPHRVIAQPDVTAKRETIPQPDVTVQRQVPAPEAPQAAPEASQVASEAKPPQSPRQLLPILIGGLAAAITVAVILALLLG